MILRLKHGAKARVEARLLQYNIHWLVQCKINIKLKYNWKSLLLNIHVHVVSLVTINHLL